MSGRWKVKHPDLIELHAQARALASRFDWIRYEWMPRARNTHADRLANEAMDAAAEADDLVEKPARLPSPRKRLQRNRRPAGPVRAAHRPGCCCCVMGRPSCRCIAATPGRGNPELTELGRRQAAAAARYLAQRGGIAAVVSSPLQRAYDTAAAAAKALGLDVTVDDDLIETDFGAWEGLTFTEAAERDPDLHRRWLRDTSTKPPGGESFDEALDRVHRARARIIAAHQGTTVLVVSHVTPIKMLLRLALDAGPGILYRLHLDLASLSIAEFYSDGASSVRLVNQTGYL